MLEVALTINMLALLACGVHMFKVESVTSPIKIILTVLLVNMLVLNHMLDQRIVTHNSITLEQGE